MSGARLFHRHVGRGFWWDAYRDHERFDTPLGRVTVRRHIRGEWWDAHPVDDLELLRSLRGDFPRGVTPQAAVDALLEWAESKRRVPPRSDEADRGAGERT